MNSFERLNETELPSKDNFFNRLNDVYITDEDYKHAKNVWMTFGSETMSDMMTCAFISRCIGEF